MIMMWPSYVVSVSPIMIRREMTRTRIAYGVIGALGIVTLLLIIWAFVHGASLQTLLTGIFTPVIGIAGTVIGFYFAGEKGK